MSVATVDWVGELAQHGGIFPQPGWEPAPPVDLAALIYRLANPTSEDVQWVTDALRHDERKWFIASLAGRAKAPAEAFLAPMLDAGIDEVDRSFNKLFIGPCKTSFGLRRVLEYLLDVVESGTDLRKLGAVNLLYWVPLSPVHSRFPSIEYDNPKAIADLIERTRRVLLGTFVSSSNADLRSIIRFHLDRL